MEVGKKKGTFRLRLIDLETGKSKTMTIYSKEEKKKPSLSEVMKKLISGLREN